MPGDRIDPPTLIYLPNPPVHVIEADTVEVARLSQFPKIPTVNARERSADSLDIGVTITCFPPHAVSIVILVPENKSLCALCFRNV